jgi:dTMP kinase
MQYTAREEQLVQLLGTQEQSASHLLDHLNRVAHHGKWLAEKYGASPEIVVAAALLHDLGRKDLTAHGKASAELGAVFAEPLLEKAGYDTKERNLILQAIAEHDQPDLHSTLLEARILKDADFLDGFGARGILRSLIYSGETQGGIPAALERLKAKTRQRIEGLEFVESRRLGWKLYRLTELFLSELAAQQNLELESYSGKLIFLEGISGSGKDTQAELLQKKLTEAGKTARVINHPSAFLKSIWKIWRSEGSDLASESFLILADRLRKVREELLPALQRGEVVISSRSSIDIQVYQHNPEISDEFYRFAFTFEPTPDLVVYLDLDVAEAFERAGKRVEDGEETDRGFFNSQQEQQKVRYAEVLPFYPNVMTVNAGGNIEEVHRQIVSCLHTHLSLL